MAQILLFMLRRQDFRHVRKTGYAGFPPVILPVEKRLEYYEALDKAHMQTDYAPFFLLISEIVEASFKPYFFALGIEEGEEATP